MLHNFEEELENDNLKYSVVRERKLLQVLDESTTELTRTIEDLEKKLNSIDEENNEWKTRYDIQKEINEQYSKQILLLQDKVLAAKKQVKEVQKAVRSNTLHTDFGEITLHMVRMLEDERESLISQRRDLDWRIDQESKAYYRACEERKGCQMELQAASISIAELKLQTQQSEKEAELDHVSSTARSVSPINRHSPKRTIGLRNIPQDHRILNIRQGPIRKTAAVRQLPTMNATSSRNRFR